MFALVKLDIKDNIDVDKFMAQISVYKMSPTIIQAMDKPKNISREKKPKKRSKKNSKKGSKNKN
jgi:hypothetical protein